MRQSKSKIPTLKLQDLGSWQESMGCNFLKKADLQAGIFIIQFPGMNDIAKANLLIWSCGCRGTKSKYFSFCDRFRGGGNTTTAIRR
jgi:hypothetical protein